MQGIVGGAQDVVTFGSRLLVYSESCHDKIGYNVVEQTLPWILFDSSEISTGIKSVFL